ncbi:MAG: ABC transporter ATP-binding protein [Phycisphaerales bacterium JB063]
MIELDAVSKSFDGGGRYAVRGVALRVARGETMVLLGASGCGKTTTLKMINRLIEPTSGTVRVDGEGVLERDVLSLRRSIGYVFQDIGLFPHLTVRENAGMVLRLLGWSAARRRERVDELMAMVGLEPGAFGGRSPRQLSGGQQQRVGIARALAADPAYLLMDEPFGALDAVTREQLQSELDRIKKELGKTVVFVTHDLFEAVRLGDRIAVMNEGRIEQVDRPGAMLESPATPFVAELFGHATQQAKRLLEGGGA